jgi:U3 small nucleolar RNA-associated protein 10
MVEPQPQASQLGKAGKAAKPSTTTAPRTTPTHITESKLNLYKSTLTLLKTSMTHDSDTFFAHPTHFTPLSTLLISQLTLAASSSPKPLRTTIFSHVLPTIVALATATIDTPAHHHALNHGLCQLRHNSSPGVRLAAIRTHLALTHDEDVGEEWVNNVVVGTSSVTEGGGGSGETMVYVNESLEDDDEEVEREVRRWVRLVREMVGEDVFEV